MTEEKRLCIDGPFKGAWLTACGDMVIPCGKDRIVKYQASEILFADTEGLKIWVCGELSLGSIVEALDDMMIPQ